MDTLKSLREIDKSELPKFTKDSYGNYIMFRGLWNERNSIAWGRYIALRLAFVGWALFFASLFFR